MKTKVCPTHGPLRLSKFYYDHTTRDRLQKWCKECQKRMATESQRSRRLAEKQKIERFTARYA